MNSNDLRGTAANNSIATATQRDYIQFGTEADAAPTPRKGFGLAHMIGLDADDDVSWTTRRRIMSALRQSCRVMGPGQKSRIGRLGGGAALGAIVAGFAAPAFGQAYGAGGGSATGVSSTAVGQNAQASGQGASAFGVNTTASAQNTTAIGVGAQATSIESVAIGFSAVARGPLVAATAIGSQASAQGSSSVAVGSLASTSGVSGGIAVGSNADSTAENATAIGVNSIASGTNSNAIGTEARASGVASLAIGGGNLSSGLTSIAIGVGSQATAAKATALGSGGTGTAATATRATAAGATALGGNAVSGAAALGVDSIAIGGQSIADGVAPGSVAIGLGVTSNASVASNVAIGRAINNTNRGNSTAIGSDIEVLSNDTIAIGGDINIDANSANSIFLGNKSTATNYTLGTSTRSINLITDGNLTAISGSARAVTIDTTTSAASNFSGNAGSLIIRTASPDGSGTSPGGIANATNSILINAANPGATVADVVSIGRNSLTSATSAVAIGLNTSATATNSVALGNNATAANAGNVALGSGSVAGAANTGSFTLNGGTVAGTTAASVVSLGAVTSKRQIQNVAAGVVAATSTDAINGSQLFTVGTAVDTLGNSLQSAIGGPLVVGNDGTVTTAPSFSVGGTTYNNVAAAITALDAAGGAGGSTLYFNANSTLADSSATGVNSVAIGPQSIATKLDSIAAGNNAAATGDGGTALGVNSRAQGDGSTAVGQNTTAAGIGATAMGNGTIATGNFGTAVGNGATAGGANATSMGRTASAAGASSVAIGHDVVASATDTVAIGHATSAFGPGSVSVGRDQISTGAGAVSAGQANTANGPGSVAIGGNNVAAGNAAATLGASGAIAIGQGNTATGSASVAIGVGNTASAAGAIALGNGATASNAGSVALGSGSATAAPNTGAFTINGGTVAGTTSSGVVSVGSATARRQIQNVAAGVVSATSTDAVNGSQLYVSELATNNMGDAIETLIGGGTVLNADGTIATNPAIMAAGLPYANVTDAIEALDTANTKANDDLAAALGGGASVDPDGTVTGPVYTVDGNTYNDVGAALGALEAASQYPVVSGNVSDLAASTAAGADALAVGYGNTASGASAVAMGVGITASGANSVAIGSDGTAAQGDGSVAIGQGQTAIGRGAVAIGDPNVATGIGAVTVGADNTATGQGANAQGNLNTAIGLGAVALGDGNRAAGIGAIAIGQSSLASAAESIALGSNATASGIASNAQGTDAVAAGFRNIAIGEGATTAQNYSIAIGEQSQATGRQTLAVGSENFVTGSQSMAFGNNIRVPGLSSIVIGGDDTRDAIVASNITGTSATYSTVSGAVLNPTDFTLASASGNAALVVGFHAQATGDYSQAMGLRATSSGVGAIAVGGSATAAGNGSLAVGAGSRSAGLESSAFGNLSSASAAESLALGSGAVASNAGAVALGSSSVTAAPNTGAFTLNGGTAAAIAPASVVSVGAAGAERQITNVAAGVVSATSTNAINGSQLFIVATAANNLGDSLETVTGGGLVMNADGTIATPPTINAAGAPFGNVTAAIEALDLGNNTANTGIADAIGGGMAIAADGTVTPPSFDVNGSTFNNVDDALAAAGAGFNFTTAAAGTGTMAGTSVSGVGAGETLTVTAGNNLVGTQTGNGVALALNPALTGITSMAVTGGPTIDGTGINMNGDKITGLAAGSTAPGSTEAVNGSQLNLVGSSVASHLGGGSVYNPVTGAVTTPNYVIAGTTYNDVGSALGGLAAGGARQRYFNANSTLPDSTAAGVDSVAIGPNAVAANAGDVALGNGSVTVVPNTGAFTLNGGTVAATAPTSVVSIGAVGNERQLQNVAAGVVSATSTDAINGSQLFAVATAANNLGDSMETITGGGLTMNPDGTIATPPSISVGGVTYANVTDAIEAGDDKADATGADVADALGGGAAFDPATGVLTAPNYVLGGNTYNNVGDALSDLASGGLGPVQYADAATPTTPNGGTPTNNLALVGAAAGPVVLDNVAPGTLAAGSTQAVNGGQINTGLASVATNTGGGSVFDPTTGTVTAPTITVGGTAYDNITDAIEAGDDKADEGLQDVADALGGGATYDPATGAIAAPAYTIQGNTYNNVGSALGAVDNNLNNILNGTAGLVQQVGGSPGTGQITVGAATGGTSLSVAGTDGDRTVTGVLAGALTPTSTDAVNGSQVNALASSIATNIGGGSTFDPVTGTVTAPAVNVNGSTYTNLTEAIQAAGGGFNLTTAATGTGSAISSSVSQVGAGETATITAGNNIITTQIGNEVQVALNPVVTGITSISVTGGATIDGNGINMNGDGITGLAAGSTAAGSTDAVNGSQINTGLGSVATNLGGGSTYNSTTGTVTAPTYTVQGNTYNNVGGALGGVDAAISNLTNGTTGIVQQTGGAPGSGPITVGAATGGTVVNMAGTAGNRTVTGVAPAALTATSTDAVNGSQVNALASSVANNLGGGSTFNPVTGTVSAPTYTVGGTTVNNVGDAFTQLQSGSPIQYSTAAAPTTANGLVPSQNVTLVGAAAGPVTLDNVAPGSTAATSTQAVNGGQLNTGLASVASGLGGGSTYNPATGQVTAPSYTVGGATYNSVGGALAATQRSGVQYVADANGNPTNAVRLSGDGTGAPVAVTNLAAGAVNATSRDAVNGSQLHSVQQAADAGVQYVRRPDGTLDRSTLALGTPGAPTQLKNLAAGVAPTDGVNVGQMQAALAGNLQAGQGYTDAAVSAVRFDLGKVAKRSYAGTASALALQSPALFEPGQLSMRGGVGTYRGEWALGLGFRATADNGRWSLSGGVSGGPNSGVAASAGIDFVIGN
jgi:trimeric autotransporter adhesin